MSKMLGYEVALWEQAYKIYDDLLLSGGDVDGLKKIHDLVPAAGATTPRSIHTLMRKRWVSLE